MKIFLNITTEDGELLERVEVELQDDLVRPLGSSLNQGALMAEVESAARTVMTRARNAEREAALVAFATATAEPAETEEQQERRLAREAHTRLIPDLGDFSTSTDTARVEVQWVEDGVYHCGHYIVNVNCEDDDPESEEGGPYARAHDLVSEHLEARAEKLGWDGWEILDIEAA